MDAGAERAIGPRAPEAPTPEACARDLMETVPAVMRFIRAEMRRHRGARMSVPQFRTLALLGRMPGSSLSDVAEHLGVSRPTASVLVDRLVRQGLVDRTQHPHERRRVALSLTREGEALLERARAHTRARIAGTLAALSPAQLACLAEGLALLRRLFETEGERRPAS